MILKVFLAGCIILWMVAVIFYGNNPGESGIYAAAFVFQGIGSTLFSIFMLFFLAKKIAKKKLTSSVNYFVPFIFSSLHLIYTRINILSDRPVYVDLIISSVDFYSRDKFVIEYIPPIVFSSFFWLLLSIARTGHAFFSSALSMIALFLFIAVLKNFSKKYFSK